MADQSIRRQLAALEQHGELLRFTKQIDPDENMSAVSWKSFSELGKSCLFENIKDHPDWRVASQVVANRAKWGIALGVDEADVVPTLNERIHQPVDPVLVDAATAPVKQVIELGKDVDLTQLPAMWTSERDPGRYIASGICVIKDPDTGIRNVSVHRAQIIAADRTGYLICPRQALKIFQMYGKAGKPMEAAMVIGGHPAMIFGAGFVAPYGQDEFTIAGGLLGEPIRLVKCETIDMEVPADAELVLEGELYPDESTPEGPFGEVTGTYAQEGSTPLFRVKAVTRRKDPIFYAMQCGLPPSDTHSIICTTIEMRLWDHLRNVAGGIDLLDVRCIAAMTPMMIVVKLRPKFRGQVRAALLAALSSPYLHPKIAVAVGEDVDANDLSQVFRAIALNVDPTTDVHKVDGARVFALDNASPVEPGMSAMYRMGTKLLIDATGRLPDSDVRRQPADRRAIADALGVDPATAITALVGRLATPVPPATLAADAATVHQQTLDAVNLPTGDAAPRHAILVAGTSDAPTIALIDCTVTGSASITVADPPWRLQSNVSDGQPVAIVIGAPAAAQLAAAVATAAGDPAWPAAGALFGEPLDLVVGPNGVAIPANAALALFGNVTGETVDVTAVWHRGAAGDDAAHFAPSPGHAYTAMGIELAVARHLSNVEGGIDVHDVCCYPETDYRLVVVKFRPRVGGQSKTACMAALSSPDLHPRLAVAVDDDINAEDLRDVAWSMASRLHAEIDTANLGAEAGDTGRWFFDTTMPPPTQPEGRAAFERAIPKNLSTTDLADFLPEGT